MNVEKISEHKVRIFISYDDLANRGIDRDEIWQNGRKVQELFWDMMETAYQEVGFEIVGPIAVEAFTMPNEGVIVVVTQVPSLPGQEDQFETELEIIHTEDPEVSSSSGVIVFRDFEDVISLATSVHEPERYSTSLYKYKERYFLHVTDLRDSETPEDEWAQFLEYAEDSAVTKEVLDEYGASIIQGDALQTLSQYFQ